jgi:capsular exopolysaccharide synthesis family protein
LISQIVTEATMDAIQTYRGYPTAPSPMRGASAPSPAHGAVNPAAVKSTADYLRALRRRFWVVLAVAVPMAVLGCIYALRMPPVYLVKGEIEIDVPDYDPTLSTLVSHDLSRRDAATQSQYIPNRAAQLKSVRLQERVVGSPDLHIDLSQFEDPVNELFGTLNVVPVQRGGNTFIVSLEGRDPLRTTRLLEALVVEFQAQAKKENGEKIFASKEKADRNLENLKKQQVDLRRKIGTALANSKTFGAGGKSILEEKYVNLSMLLSQKQLRLGELNQQMLLMQSFPMTDRSPEGSRKESLIAQLESEQRYYTEMLEYMQRSTRNFNSDGYAIALKRKLEAVLDQLDELKNVRTQVGLTPTEMIIEQYRKEIESDKEDHDKLLTDMRAHLPKHQEILDLMADGQQKAKQIADMEAKLAEFDILSESMTSTDFVKVQSSIAEPSVPIKPNRGLLIAACLIVSLAMGIGLVCLLEHVDHAIKVAEHVSHGLTLPLLGVVPRIRRTALTQRGSHLWTPGSSDALACDAYRNVRASLLAVADRRGPIVTLLVTSAKAGEGKSTTALNLAATCALAGERTLLLDIDLRRPSLAEVFIEDEDPRSILGVADVLKGEVPWQRTLRHTRIPNLDFMPTGNTRDTPIEILGTLELRQLLAALSGHYDRVILDGPAVLGLADCRFLGRMVDASLLVVRSGSHHLTTLHRAKAMLEQSHVAIAGVVFNGLTEDMENWSSYYGEYGALPAIGRAEVPAEDQVMALAGR